MNLDSLRNNIKTISIIAIFAIVLLVLAFLIFSALKEVGVDIRFGNISPLPINQLESSEKVFNYEVKLSEDKDFGGLVKVAKVEHTKISLSKISKIKNLLGFKTNPKKIEDPHKGGVKYVWLSEDKTLYFYLLSGEIIYNNNALKSNTKEKSKAKLEDIAKSTMKRLDLDYGLENIVSSPVVIKDNLIEKSNEYSNGEEITFSNKFSDYKIVEVGLEGYASVTVGNDRIVRQIHFLPSPEVLEEGVYPARSIGPAKKELEGGRAIIAEVKNKGVNYTLPNYNLSTIKVGDVELVYMKHLDSEYLQPYFSFRGVSRMDNGDMIESVLLVNAIDDKYLEGN